VDGTLDLSSLAAGPYVLLLTHADGSTHQARFMKEQH
jgi:hypothetical protein